MDILGTIGMVGCILYCIGFVLGLINFYFDEEIVSWISIGLMVPGAITMAVILFIEIIL